MASSPLEIITQQPKPPKIYPRLNTRLQLVKWLAIVGGLVVLLGGSYECYQQFQLREHGVKIKGKLFDSNKFATGKGRISYNVIVDYAPKEFSKGIRKQFNVPERVYNEVTRTGQTTVTYLPGDPTHSEIGEKASIDSEKVILGAIMLLVGIAIHNYLKRQLRQVEAYVLGETS